MNKETLESIKRMTDGYRADVLRGNFDIRSILTCLLTFVDEMIKYELDRLKDTNAQISI